MLTFLLVPLFFLQDAEPGFRDVRLQKPFDAYLQANPVLMDVTGAKIIRLPSGNRVVLGVASTPVRDSSAADRKRAETVCKNRALSSILSEKKGLQVAHMERVKTKTVVVIETDGKESGKSVTDYLELDESKVKGWVQDFPVVGRWKSADGSLFYLAIGGMIDADGNKLTEPYPEEGD